MKCVNRVQHNAQHTGGLSACLQNEFHLSRTSGLYMSFHDYPCQLHLVTLSLSTQECTRQKESEDARLGFQFFRSQRTTTRWIGDCLQESTDPRQSYRTLQPLTPLWLSSFRSREWRHLTDTTDRTKGALLKGRVAWVAYF